MSVGAGEDPEDVAEPVEVPEDIAVGPLEPEGLEVAGLEREEDGLFEVVGLP